MTDLTEYCEWCNNFFLKDYINYTDIFKGDFEISGGGFVSPAFTLKNGQYFRIKGSDLNDGVYCNSVESLALLRDESFSGQVWLMSVQRGFIALCEEADAWRAKNEALDSANMSPFTSENISGVYSYSKGSGSSSNSGNGSSSVSYKDVFKSRFSAYRRTTEL